MSRRPALLREPLHQDESRLGDLPPAAVGGQSGCPFDLLLFAPRDSGHASPAVSQRNVGSRARECKPGTGGCNCSEMCFPVVRPTTAVWWAAASDEGGPSCVDEAFGLCLPLCC